ncbi:MAG: type II toxin-antitoxin system HicB family antitoxin [Salaquimonas sp.]|jgi:predicted HicB family RNase H-like nuclease|nr:type II toxin-antitoxin system HicB family antitoxin [Salaquimonas sp.]
MKSYKSYTPSIWYERDDRLFHGVVAGIRDTVHFAGEGVEELEQAFKDSVDEYLAMCAEDGTEPDKPYSGKIALRLAPEIHEMVSEAAVSEAKSVNQWIADTLKEAAERQIESGSTKIRIR